MMRLWKAVSGRSLQEVAEIFKILKPSERGKTLTEMTEKICIYGMARGPKAK